MVSINYRDARTRRNQKPGVFVLWWLVSLLCVFCVDTAVAQQWYPGEFSVALANLKPEEARAKAWQGARHAALESAKVELIAITSRHISESSGPEIFDAFARLSHTVTSGRIVEEKFLFDNIEEVAGQWRYRVSLQARIEPDVGEPDPAFRVELNLDRETYRDGDPLVARITATRDCYLTLFNLYSNDSLSVLLPNSYAHDNFLRGTESLTYPPEDVGWELFVRLTEGQSSETGALLVVAMKDEVPFTLSRAGQNGDLVAAKEALTAINRWLINVPADRRTEDIAQYVIVK